MRLLLRSIAALLLCFAVSTYVTTTLAHAQSSSQPSDAASTSNPSYRFVPPWALDGQLYLSYSTFRDDFALALRSATSKILIATYAFSDGDLASALYAAHTRGIFVGLLLDDVEARKKSQYESLLLKQKVFVFQTKLTKYQMEGLSTFVIDTSVWRTNARLDERTPGSVRVDRSPFTSDEVLDWFRRPKQKVPPSAVQTPRSESAKPPTNTHRPSVKIFGTIPKENSSPSKVEKAIPLKLPRETRIQRMRKGVDSFESASDERLVPSSTPVPSSREGELSGDF